MIDVFLGNVTSWWDTLPMGKPSSHPQGAQRSRPASYVPIASPRWTFEKKQSGWCCLCFFIFVGVHMFPLFAWLVGWWVGWLLGCLVGWFVCWFVCVLLVVWLRQPLSNLWEQMFVHCPCCCHHMSLLVGPKDDYLFLDRLYIKGKSSIKSNILISIKGILVSW